jgi:hypothetical protein
MTRTPKKNAKTAPAKPPPPVLPTQADPGAALSAPKLSSVVTELYPDTAAVFKDADLVEFLDPLFGQRGMNHDWNELLSRGGEFSCVRLTLASSRRMVGVKECVKNRKLSQSRQ